jgi:hypothetical protein
VEWANVVRDQTDKDSNAEKGYKKGERGDEKAAARAVGNGGADQKADAGEMKEKEKCGDNKGGKEEKNLCAGSDVHLSIETSLREGVEVGKSARKRSVEGFWRCVSAITILLYRGRLNCIRRRDRRCDRWMRLAQDSGRVEGE